MKTLKALGEYTHTHTHTLHLPNSWKKRSIGVLANKAKAYLLCLNFNFHKINNRDGETI